MNRLCTILTVLVALAVTAIVTPMPAEAVLRVTGTTPNRYALHVPIGITQITATFNGPLSTLPQGCVRVCGTISGLHAGSVQLADNVITFQNGTEPFLPGEVVTVNYRNDIRNPINETLTGGFVFAFTIASAPASMSWSTPRTYPVAYTPYFIYGGDLDEDNTPDVAIPNEDSNDVAVLLNTYGLGTFPPHRSFGVGDHPSCVFGEDLDNDGDQDLVTADIDGGTISVLRNNGDGTFAPRQVYPAGAVCRQVHGGDFDGDNDVDLCATSYQDGILCLYYNNGDGTFTQGAPITTISNGPWAVRCADVNGDGHLDIAVACQDADNLDVFLNNGTGAFTRAGSYNIGDGPWCLNGNDLDGDGDFDLVSVASFADQLVVLFNNGAGAFTTRQTASTQSFPLGVFAADLDGDGDIDVTSSNYSGASVGIFLNPGNGHVAFQRNLSVAVSGSYTWAHDLDNDGDLDLSVVDEESDLLYVFYNGALPSGTPPPDVAVRGERPRIFVFPNPIDSGATVRLEGISGNAIVDLIGCDGRRLGRLWSGTLDAQGEVIAWDGRGPGISRLPAGRYFVVAHGGDGASAIRDVVVLGR